MQATAQAAMVEPLGFIECEIQLPVRIRLVATDEDITVVVFLASIIGSVDPGRLT